MRILYIDESNSDSDIIASYLKNAGIELRYMFHPVDIDEMTYMTEFSANLGEFKPDFVFGTVFYPFISLACGITNMRYRVWITPEYNCHNYDFQIKNDRDQVFVADKQLFEFYIRLGMNNVQYLPLSYSMLRGERIGDQPTETDEVDTEYDACVISPCTYNESSINEVMPLLKDSTKGYLDAYIQSRKNDVRIAGIYSRFPSYIQEDIENNYTVSEDSYETKAMKYDNTYFYPHIDRSVAVAYPLSLISIDVLQKVAVYTPNGFPYYNEKMDVIPISDDRNVESQLSRAKIAVCIPKLQDGSGLPPYAYGLIRRGYAVIAPSSLDEAIASTHNIPTFGNSNALVKLVRLYLSSEIELNKLKEKQKEALSKEVLHDDLLTVLFG